MMTSIPLKDVTQLRLSSANKVAPAKSEIAKPIATAQHEQRQPQPSQAPARRYRHDPYNWNWRMPASGFDSMMPMMTAAPSQAIMPLVVAPTMQHGSFAAAQQQVQSPQASSPLAASTTETENFVPQGDTVCCALIQFKCHHGEFSSTFELRKGQYVVVQGDRGIDVGVVIRINTEENQQYVQRTGPSGPVLRYATQREVDYWATDLKADEGAALDYCKQRVVKHRLTMDVRHAEYQFDKKKLTFYYEAKSRVDFVTLLKELFREFSCRIWMEKIRSHE